MATFDPNADYETTIPPGTYLLALTSYERKVGKSSGKPYLRCRYQIIDGPAKGESFFSNLGIDVANRGAMFRLKLMAEAVGLTQAFDLDDDRAFNDAFVNKPFKALLKSQRNGDFVNTEIDRYQKDVSPGERDILQSWMMDRAEEGAFDGGGGGYSDGASSDFSDDIPF